MKSASHEQSENRSQFLVLLWENINKLVKYFLKWNVDPVEGLGSTFLVSLMSFQLDLFG